MTTLGSQRTEAVEALTRAALAILDVDGVDAITVRSLAARTFYSPSTVGYHTHPFRTFLDELWQQISAELAVHVFADRPTHAVQADRLLRWAHDHPRRAAFFTGHTAPRPDRPRPELRSVLRAITATAADAPTAAPEVIDERVLSRVQLTTRRLQAALEYALQAFADDSERRTALADELVSLTQLWQHLPSSTPSPPLPPAAGAAATG